MEWALVLKFLPEIIVGVLKFPKEIRELVRVLSGTPAEKRESIMNRVRGEQDKFVDSGRPVW